MKKEWFDLCIVTMKTMTSAQKGRSALERAGIENEIVSLDKFFASGGCAYGLSFPCRNTPEVKRILSAYNVNFGRFIGDRSEN